MEVLSKNPKETKALARDFCAQIAGRPGPLIVELVGDLGAGKTTFMQGVGEFFGLKEPLVSPTFVIQKVYDLPSSVEANLKKLIHIDAYRIENGEELNALSWERCATDPSNLIFIEWPKNMQTNLHADFEIRFEHVSEDERKITIIKNVKDK